MQIRNALHLAAFSFDISITKTGFIFPVIYIVMCNLDGQLLNQLFKY